MKACELNLDPSVKIILCVTIIAAPSVSFEEIYHVGQVFFVLKVAQMAATRVDLGPFAEELPQIVKLRLGQDEVVLVGHNPKFGR